MFFFRWFDDSRNTITKVCLPKKKKHISRNMDINQHHWSCK